MSRKRTTEEFIELAKEVHGERYDYSLTEYKTKEDKVDIICPLHGVFSQNANLHLHGSGCPKCSYIQRGMKFKKGLGDFIIDANKVHNSFYSYDKFIYTNAHTKGIITCPIHGDFEQKPNDHLLGKGCPTCKMSHLEREIFSFLKEYSVRFEYQKKVEWLGKQSLDFYLQDYNIAIECQGKQHFGIGGWSKDYDFNVQKERDILKRDLCIRNGVKLIYFTHESFEYNELYQLDNIFNDVIDILENVLHIKRKTWKDEFYTFYNSLLLKYQLKPLLEVFCIDLEAQSEQHVTSSHEINRLIASRKQGNMSIHIFEDEWIHKRSIVESRIRNCLGITETKVFARKCEIKEVSYLDSKIFLDANHIQGSINSRYNLGLYYNGELVSLMTFGNLRKSLGSTSKESVFELLRFCNKLDNNVVGGASKLFKHFIKKNKPDKIISYCDLRWSHGNLYETLGFQLSHISRPNYFYVDKVNCRRENRYKYRKDALVKEGFDKNKSEHEIMLGRGIYRIYDCGCNVYIYKGDS